LLSQTIKTVLSQIMPDYEVIVVDDGSSDGTLEYLQSLGNKVQVLNQANRGPGSARNLGIEKARGKYIAFLDSDDLWFPWTLEVYSSVVESANFPSFIAGRPFIFRKEAEIENVLNGSVSFDPFADYFASGEKWRWWSVSSFVIKTSILKNCGGFVEKNMNGEDGDLALKLGDAPGFIQITSPYTFAYRDHPANVMKDLSKTVRGVWHKVNTEWSGGYPGGSGRARERWRILTRHVRPVTLDCLCSSLNGEAWKLYSRTFRWHWALGRWRYLAGFPIKAIFKK